MTAIVIASTRRFVAESLALVLSADDSVSECVVVTQGAADLHRAQRAAGPCITLFDLDAPVDEIGRLAAPTAPELATTSRRCGFFDTFGARHAQAAFELSITVLVALSTSPRRIIDAVLRESKELSVTPSEGLTLEQLERLASLSPREMEVLQLLGLGRSTAAIARLLGITTHTASSHKRRIVEKLDVQSQAEAVVLAATGGVVTVDLT